MSSISKKLKDINIDDNVIISADGSIIEIKENNLSGNKIADIYIDNVKTELFSKNSISDVYLTKDIDFKGNYTLGNKKQEISSSWTAKAGTSIESVLIDLFSGEEPDGYPTITYPSMSILLSTNPKYVLEGQQDVSVSYELKFDPGIYTTTLQSDTKYQQTNVNILSCSISCNDIVSTELSGTFTGINLTAGQELTISAKIHHSGGSKAKTYNGVQTISAINRNEIFNSSKFACISNNYFIIYSDLLSTFSDISDDNIEISSTYRYVIKPDKLENSCSSKYIGIYVPKNNFEEIMLGNDIILGKNIQYSTKKYDCLLIGNCHKWNILANTKINYI